MGPARVLIGALLALALLAAAPSIFSQQDNSALMAMVETERAFAALGAEKGVQVSFFKYFGEEGISFGPHPQRFREQARKSLPPNPPPPLQFKLEWWPVYGDVAESGDLGYNTGPTLVTDRTSQNRPARHGYFFSVWKRQPAGNWEVAVDMGSDTPGADAANQDRLRYTRAPHSQYKKVKPRDAAAGRAEMLSLEDKFLKSATHHGGPDAYRGYVAEHCRVHWPGIFPILGRDAAAMYFDSVKLGVIDWEGIDGGIAGSGELGYTYGRFTIKVTREGSERERKGYFTRVWKRNVQGDWKIVAEVINPLPLEEKK